MAHVTGTDLQDLQFDALGTTTAGNPQLPASPVAGLNKALKTSAKVVIAAINELVASGMLLNSSFTSLANTYNGIIGDTGADPTLLTDLHKVDQNLILSVLKMYKELHGTDLDNPQALTGSIVDMITAATIATGTAQQYIRGDHTLAVLDTSAIAEGTNKYYTDARVLAYLSGIANTPSNPAFLNASGKIDSSLLDISAGLTYSGLWDPTTNTPTLPTTPTAGSNGVWYKVSADGTWNSTTWHVGDWIVSSGVAWERVDNTAFVVDVFGRKGAIVAQAADYASFYVALSGSYSDPVWLTGVNASKIVGTITPVNLGSGTADATTFLRGDGTWAALPTSGTVTSVGVDMPTSEFTVSLSPITSSGVIGVAWKTQAALTVFAAPVAGGVPEFRELVAADIPALDASKVATGTFTASQIPVLDASKIDTGVLAAARLGTGTADASTVLHGDGTWGAISTAYVASVGLQLPSIFTVTNSPVTSTGTLTATLVVQAQGTVFSGPATGADSEPGFRALVPTDIPALDAAKITSGTFTTSQVPTLDADKIGSGVLAVARLGTGTADATVYLRGDGTWSVLPTSGTVTSVGLAAPAEFTVTSSPVTGAGTLTMAWADVGSAGYVFAAPAGAAGAPGFRGLVASDIPTLDAAKVSTGVFAAARIPELDAAKITTGVLATARLGSGTANNTTYLRGDGTWTSITIMPGTVTSVGLSLPDIFTVTNSPVTGAGTLTATLAAQTASFVFAAPVAGGAPSFRALDAADIPNLDAAKVTTGVLAAARIGSGTADATTYLRGDSTWATTPTGTVTSVDVTAPAEFSVTGGPVTGVGTLALAWASVASAGYVFASPAGAAGTPGFRGLVASDIPALDAAKIATGVFSTARLGAGVADATVYLRGDGAWVAPAFVTSVGLSAPAEFTVTNSPVTGAGNLALAWASMNVANYVFASPVSGTGVPEFRALATSDIPNLDTSKITTGVFGTALIPSLDAAQTTTGVFSTARLGAGVADASVYLRGDGAWVAPAFVTSVGLTLPAEFTVTNSPVTGAGTLTATWDTVASGNYVFASPDAIGGVPGFRALMSSDIPALDAAKISTGVLGAARIPDLDAAKITAGTVSTARLGSGTADATTFLRGDGTWAVVSASGSVTSVGLSLPADFTVTNSPVTGAGTLTATWASKAANLFLASPNGAAGAPVFRAMLAADVPALDAAKVTTGTLGTARLGSGTANANTYLRGDGTWATITSVGTVTSVGLSLPSIFTVSNSPVTGAGTLTATLASQAANLVFAAPIGGGSPIFRTLDASDIASLSPTFTSTSSQTFTGTRASAGSNSAFIANSAVPSYAWYVPAAATNYKLWDLYVDTDSNRLVGRAISDNGGLSNEWLGVTRNQQAIASIRLGATTTVAGALTANSFARVGGTSTQYLMADGSVSLNTGSSIFDGGSITFNNTTSNWIDFGTSGVSGPATSATERSVGTKIVLYNALSASTFEYAIGVGPGNLWTSFPTGASASWYSGASMGTAIMSLSDAGTLTVRNDVQSGGTNSGLVLTGVSGSASGASLCLYVPGNATNNKSYDIYANSAGLYFGIRGDTNTANATYLNVTRTAVAVTTTSLYGATLRLGYDGASLYSTAIAIGGAGCTTTFTGTVTGLSGSAITTGTVAPARLGSGTANNTVFLRGDGTWQSVAATQGQAATIWNNANGIAGTSGAWTKVPGYTASYYGASGELAFDYTNKRFTAATAGWYTVTATVMIQSTSGTITQANAVTYYTQCAIYKNGNNVSMSSNTIPYIAGNCQCFSTTTTMVYLGVGDYVEHWYYTNIPSPNVYYSYNNVPFCTFSFALIK